jgi:hypothetical protein
MLKIRLQSPWQLPLTANDRIVADRSDQHDFHIDVRAAERVTGILWRNRSPFPFGKSQKKLVKRHDMIRRSVINARTIVLTIH